MKKFAQIKLEQVRLLLKSLKYFATVSLALKFRLFVEDVKQNWKTITALIAFFSSVISLIYFVITYVLVNPWPVNQMAVVEGRKPSMLMKVTETNPYHPVYDGFGQPMKEGIWYRRYRENAQLFPLPKDTILLQTNAASGVMVESQIVIGTNQKSPITPVHAEVLCF